QLSIQLKIHFCTLLYQYTELLITRPLHFFFFNDTTTTEIYTLSLHDALPICVERGVGRDGAKLLGVERQHALHALQAIDRSNLRSEEHTSELQSRFDLVCRLLLEKKK